MTKIEEKFVSKQKKKYEKLETISLRRTKKRTMMIMMIISITMEKIAINDIFLTQYFYGFMESLCP